jgi:chemotaxis protein CheD
MNKVKQAKHFLHPSTIWISKEPYWVTTVLGSCVSICLFDKKKCIGGINHFMLPYWNGEGLESPRYGNVAILQLYKKMLDLGAKKEDIICKIFGGAEVLGDQPSVFNVGQRNVELARKVILEMGIPVVSSSTGGKQGRKIHFNTGTGEVLQKYLAKTTQNESKCTAKLKYS